MFKKLRMMSKRVHADERGDVPVGTLLVIGLIVIPLVLALTVFGNDLTTWLSEQWAKITGSSTATPTTSIQYNSSSSGGSN